MKKLLICVFVSLCVLCVPVAAIDVPDPIDGYILDEAEVLSAETEQYIIEKNSLMDDHCGGYIEIITQDYLRCDVADYTFTVFNKWKIGGSKNNGILLVLSIQEDAFYLMYGTGIEAKIEVSEFQKVLDDHFYDAFDAGNYDKAVKDTFDGCYEILGELYGYPVTTVDPSSGGNGGSDFIDNSIFVNIGNILKATLVLILVLIILAVAFSFSARKPRTTYTYRTPRPYYRPNNYRPSPPRYQHQYRTPSNHNSFPSSGGWSGSSRSSSSGSSWSGSSSRSSSGSSWSGSSSRSSSSGSRSVRSSGGSSRGAGLGRH
ncbi:MAG: TPM domain-containing protein [Erysipelotrichaceae bacterium]|nr:TPM domain-containing protein [Erysipelotrichaceae bacterium]